MTVLKLDYDGPSLPTDFGARLRFVFATLRLEWGRVTVRRTVRGWHVRVPVLGRRLRPLTVVALQACLGSDYRRETFNLGRALALPGAPRFWRGRWNVLYLRKLARTEEPRL